MSAIPVAVYAPSGITDSLLKRIYAETEAIWSRAGITFEWHRITSKGEAGNWQFDVTIDDRRKGLQEWDAALGWITFTADGPDQLIHLSRGSAADLLRRAGLETATISMHEILVGRALGRALSHELGHYFLKSKIHTSRGLMRANWSSHELFAASRNGFELTANEREAATRLLRHEQLTDAGSSAPFIGERTSWRTTMRRGIEESRELVCAA